MPRSSEDSLGAQDRLDTTQARLTPGLSQVVGRPPIVNELRRRSRLFRDRSSHASIAFLIRPIARTRTAAMPGSEELP